LRKAESVSNGNSSVIPAKAGEVNPALLSLLNPKLDSRLRGNDDEK